jgi:hypothetical protein
MTIQYLSDLQGNHVGVQVFFPIEEWEKNQDKFVSFDTEQAPVLESLRAGLRDVKLFREGKKQLKTLQEVIDEL